MVLAGKSGEGEFLPSLDQRKGKKGVDFENSRN